MARSKFYNEIVNATIERQVEDVNASVHRTLAATLFFSSSVELG